MSETLASDRTQTPMQAIMDPASRADPYPLYEQLREKPVWHEPDGSYVISRYEDVARLIRDPRLSVEPQNSPRGGQGLSFLNMDPPAHDRLRRMTMRHFGPPNDPGRVEAMTPALEAMVTSLIDAVQGQDRIDVVANVSYPFPVTVIADLTMAYTGSLRLQLNLRAIASRQHVTKPKVSAHPRPAPSAKE